MAATTETKYQFIQADRYVPITLTFEPQLVQQIIAENAPICVALCSGLRLPYENYFRLIPHFSNPLFLIALSLPEGFEELDMNERSVTFEMRLKRITKEGGEPQCKINDFKPAELTFELFHNQTRIAIGSSTVRLHSPRTKKKDNFQVALHEIAAESPSIDSPLSSEQGTPQPSSPEELQTRQKRPISFLEIEELTNDLLMDTTVEELLFGTPFDFNFAICNQSSLDAELDENCQHHQLKWRRIEAGDFVDAILA
jgi:hypothetical protein